MAKGSSGGQRGGSAGGGGGGQAEVAISPEVSVLDKYVNDFKDFDANVNKLKGQERTEKLESLLDQQDKFMDAYAKEGKKLAGRDLSNFNEKYLDVFESSNIRLGSLLQDRITMKNRIQADVDLENGSVSLGRGSFNIKDRLKDNGFKYDGSGGWVKRYGGRSDYKEGQNRNLYNDLKNLDLI
jgi:hypothetical protein